MSERLFDDEDLAEIARLPAGDPRRAAFESRPAAHARLRAYEEFMAAGGEATTAERAEAEAKLGVLLERETGFPLTSAPGPAAPAGAARGGGAGRARDSWLARLLSPRLRPVFVTAAILVVVTVGAGLERRYREAKDPVFRGEALPAPGAWDAKLATVALKGGGVRLSWAPLAGADAYSVRFLSADLSERARVDGLAVTELALAPGALPAGLEPGAEMLWRVVATRGGDEIGRSPTATLALP